MRIGIDFDRVLFDTDSFKKRLKNKFEEFENTYDQAKEDFGYSHIRHAEIMEEELEGFEEVLESAEEFLFEDITLLENLDHELILVSRDEPEHQIEKIKHSGAQSFFDEIHIIKGNPSKRPKDSVNIDFLVDDKEYEINAVEIPTFKFNHRKHNISDIIEEIESLKKGD